MTLMHLKLMKNSKIEEFNDIFYENWYDIGKSDH